MASNGNGASSTTAGYQSEEDDWVDRPMTKQEFTTQGKEKEIKVGLRRVKRTKEAMEKYTNNRNGKWKPFFDSSTSHTHRPTKDPLINPKKARRFIGKRIDWYFLARLAACADDRVEHGDDGMCDQCKKAAPKGWTGKDHTACISVPGTLNESCTNCLYSGHIGRCSFTKEESAPNADHDQVEGDAEVDGAVAQCDGDAPQTEESSTAIGDAQAQDDGDAQPAEGSVGEEPIEDGEAAEDDEDTFNDPTSARSEQSTFTEPGPELSEFATEDEDDLELQAWLDRQQTMSTDHPSGVSEATTRTQDTWDTLLDWVDYEPPPGPPPGRR